MLDKVNKTVNQAEAKTVLGISEQIISSCS